jgi:hypothetical protein
MPLRGEARRRYDRGMTSGFRFAGSALLLAALFAPPLAGAPAPSARTPAASPAQRPTTLVQALTQQAVFAKRAAKAVGISVVDLETGRSVFGLAPDELRILASNTKLATTAAALDAFGPGTLYETKVLTRGTMGRCSATWRWWAAATRTSRGVSARAIPTPSFGPGAARSPPSACDEWRATCCWSTASSPSLVSTRTGRAIN